MKKLPQGMTLIEIVVSVAILGIMTAFGAQFVSQFGVKQDLENARSLVISSLKLARNNAIGLQKPSDLTGSMNVTQVDYVTSGDNLIVRVRGANPSDFGDFRSDILGKTGEISVTSPDIYFSAMEGKLASNLSGSPRGYQETARIVITMLGTGETRTIIVNANGSINE